MHLEKDEEEFMRKSSQTLAWEKKHTLAHGASSSSSQWPTFQKKATGFILLMVPHHFQGTTHKHIQTDTHTPQENR